MSLDRLDPEQFLANVGRTNRAAVCVGIGVGLTSTVVWLAVVWPVEASELVAACAAGVGGGFAALSAAVVAHDRGRTCAAHAAVERWAYEEWPSQLWSHCGHIHERGSVESRYRRPKERAALVERWAEIWDRRWTAASSRSWRIPLAGVAASVALAFSSPMLAKAIHLLPAAVSLFGAATLATLTRRRAAAWRAILHAWQVRGEGLRPDGPAREHETKMEAKPLPKDEPVRPPLISESEMPGELHGIMLLPVAPNPPLLEPEPRCQLPLLPFCDEKYPDPNDDD